MPTEQQLSISPSSQVLLTIILLSASMHFTTLATSYRWNHALFVLLWLVYLTLHDGPSSSILLHKAEFPAFKTEQYSSMVCMCVYMYTPCFLSLYAFVDGKLDCFHFITIVNNVAVNMECKYLFSSVFSSFR